MSTKSFNENIHIRTQEDADRIDALLEKTDKQSLDVPEDFFKKLEEGDKLMERGMQF